MLQLMMFQLRGETQVFEGGSLLECGMRSVLQKYNNTVGTVFVLRAIGTYERNNHNLHLVVPGPSPLLHRIRIH
jgi:hypothetical protein